MWKTLLVAIMICLATPARADIASVYVQGNGGVASGHVNGVPEGNAAPEYEGALGGQLGARLFVGEAYIDHAAFARNRGITRYVLGARGGLGVGGLSLFGRAGVGYLDERGGALAGGSMVDRHGLVARAGGGLESSLGSGFFLGGAVEAEYFRVSPNGTSMFGDESRTGTDMFGYMYLKLQIAL